MRQMPMSFQSRSIALIHKVTLVLSVVLLFAGLSGAAFPQDPPGEKSAFPQIQLPGFLRGEAAVQAFGGRLPEVAAWYGMEVSDFAHLLRRDRTLWAGPTGRLVYRCELEVPLDGSTSVVGEAQQLEAAPFPLDQTFRLHSSASSQKLILLDFDGNVATGTAWNSGGDLISAPFDLDGNPAAFSQAELETIQYVWQRVAEDFAPYDVDVTTQDPGPDGITRSGSTDTRYGMRVVITPSNFYPNAGGVAYLGVFDDIGDYYKPCYVFSNMLASNEKYIAEACSHETGHTLGLNHDGISGGAVYYEGHANWAPIMGNSYYKAVTQWSKGEYLNASNHEDDLAVMQNYGIRVYPDDHGNIQAAATPLTGTTAMSATGFIEKSTDVDVFRFFTGAGLIAININPAPRGPNLDILAQLFDGNGNLVAGSNPPELPALVTATVPAGTYYLYIDGTGTGDPTTGYSDYGSLGQYVISGTIVDPGPQQPPVAHASATPLSGIAPLDVSFSSAGSYDPDGSISAYSWKFGDGSSSNETNPHHVYSAAGDYVAVLTVTDNLGASSSSSVGIQVAPAPMKTLHVQGITMAILGTTRVYATATVLIQDSGGNGVSGATVTGSWSGAVQGTTAGATDVGGIVTLRSPQTRKSGIFTFTVTNVSAPGYTYDPAGNTTNSGTIGDSTPTEFAPPGDLQASGSKSKATLKWTDNNTTESGFYIERRPSGGVFARIGGTLPNTVTYTDSTLPGPGTYEYRVQAFKTGGEVTAYSNSASAKVR